MKIAAASARVAVPSGLMVFSVLPFIMPLPAVNESAGTAYSPIFSKSS